MLGGFLSTQVDLNIKEGTDIKSDLTLLEDEVVNKENVVVGVKNRRRSALSELKINPLHTIEQNKTVLSEVDMDISNEQLDEPNCEHLTNRTSLLESLMDFSHFIEHDKVQNILNPNKTISDSVEYTCVVPITNIITPAADCIKNYEDFQTMEYTQPISINNLVTEENKDIILTNINMEQTLSLVRPIIERPNSPKSILKKQSIYLNTVKNEPNMSEGTDSDVEMELTSPINIGNIYNTINNQVFTQMLPEHVAAQNHNSLDISSVQNTVAKEKNVGGAAQIKPVLNTAKDRNTRTSFIEESKIFTSNSNSTNDVNNQNHHQSISRLKDISDCTNIRTPSELCTRISHLPSFNSSNKNAYMDTRITLDIAQPTNISRMLNSLTVSEKSKENKTICKDGLICSTPISTVIEENQSLKHCLNIQIPSKSFLETSILKNSTVKFEGLEEPSFKDKPRNSYMNCLTLSLSTDDTQQLINYNLSTRQSKSDFSKIIAGDLNPSFINSKLMTLSSFSSDVFPVSLETTQELKDRKKSIGLQSTYLITNTDENNLKPSSLESISRATKINVSDQKEKTPSENMLSQFTCTVTNCNDSKFSSSDGILQAKKLGSNLPPIGKTIEELNISQENLTLSDSILSIYSPSGSLAQDNCDNIVDIAHISDHSVKNRELWQKYLKNNKSETDFIKEQSGTILKRLVNGKDIVKELKEQFAHEVNVLSQFFKRCNVDEMENEFNSSSSTSEPTSRSIQDSFSVCQTNVDFTLNLETTLTLEEKIQEKLKRGKGNTRILSMEDDLCKIATFYDTICIDVRLTNDSGIIQKLDVRSNLADDSEAVALLLHQNFINCLKDKTIQSALGERYDILSLLDYIGLNKRKSFKILDEFRYYEKKYACVMDNSFRGTFSIINLWFIWCIYVDMSDLDNISKDSVTFASEINGVYEREMKKFLVKNLKGLNFLRSFLNDVSKYANCVVQKYV